MAYFLDISHFLTLETEIKLIKEMNKNQYAHDENQALLPFLKLKSVLFPAEV
jgi:hypothetical protein